MEKYKQTENMPVNKEKKDEELDLQERMEKEMEELNAILPKNPIKRKLID